MDNFEKGVPFDPGYSPLSFSFIENIAFITRDYNQMKVLHQKKFKLSQLMPNIMDLINKSAAFYLGCMLWGGFIRYKFKNNPKEITGNHTKKLSKEVAAELDCAEEPKFILTYIENLNKDCKYLLKKPANVPELIIGILNSYIEFAEVNNNFIDVDKTSDIKLPKALSHLENSDKTQLDNLYEKIMSAINARKIEQLLNLGFYPVT